MNKRKKKDKPIGEILNYQSYIYREMAKQYPKAKTYREELEPYLNSYITLTGYLNDIRPVYVNKRTGYIKYIKLNNACINNNIIEHIWIPCKKSDIKNIKIHSIISVSGVPYEYVNKNRRNISIIADKINNFDIKQKKEDDIYEFLSV